MNSRTRTVAILGAGTMGSGIATVMARAGHRTILFDVDEANLQRGTDSVRDFIDRSVRLGKLDDVEAARAKEALVGTTDLADLGRRRRDRGRVRGCSDQAGAARSARRHLPRRRPVPHEHLDAVRYGDRRRVRLPERVVGTHYCNPAPLMKLVEVVRGRHTDDWARGTVEFLGCSPSPWWRRTCRASSSTASSSRSRTTASARWRPGRAHRDHRRRGARTRSVTRWARSSCSTSSGSISTTPCRCPVQRATPRSAVRAAAAGER